MNRVIEYLLDLVYPPRCSFCRKVISREDEGLCSECLKKLPRLEGAEQKKLLSDETVCFSPLLYENSVRDSFLRYKFYGFVSYADTYSKLIAGCIAENGLTFDLLTWVPLSKKRRKKRGYDQAELLAEGISSLLGLDCKGILYKNRETKAQSLTGGHDERLSNIKGAYSLYDGIDIKGKNILIIDDIVTTGATLSECCTVLRKAGAGSVAAAVLAKAGK